MSYSERVFEFHSLRMVSRSIRVSSSAMLGETFRMQPRTTMVTRGCLQAFLLVRVFISGEFYSGLCDHQKPSSVRSSRGAETLQTDPFGLVHSSTT